MSHNQMRIFKPIIRATFIKSLLQNPIPSTYRFCYLITYYICFLYLVLFSLSGNSLFAQSYYFRHYQVEDGLSNNTVYCSELDRHGFLWLGTKDGLDCFNGYNFKEYRSGDSTKALKDSYIRSLYIDTSSQRDILYIGTRIGVFRFDPLKEEFDYLLKTKAVVNGLTKDNNGRLWMISNKKVICLDLEKRKVLPIDAVKRLEATAVCNTPDGNIWIATAAGTIHKITTHTTGNISIENHNVFENNPQLGPKWIERIFSLRNGKILIGTSNFGAKLFDPDSNKLNSLITYNSEHNGIFARDFKEIGDSVIWMATESGIYIYNIQTGTYQNITQKTGDSYSLSDNAVYTLTIDKEGGVWAGTYSGGLNYYAHPYSNFEKYYSGQQTDAISGNVVREIAQDKYGDLWIGTEDGGLNRINSRTGKIKRFIATGKSTDISYPNIHALLAFGDTLIIGTFEHGLDIMDLRTEKIVGHFPEKTKTSDEQSSLKSTFIVSLCRTPDKNIYVGTRLGIYQFYPHKDVNGRNFEPIIPELSGAFIHTMMLDSKDRIWIGTMGNGLYCYTPSTGSLQKFTHDPDRETSIGNNWITCTYEDNLGRIWIGTEGGGLCLQNLNPDSTDVFRKFTVQDGMPANTVYKILQDDKGFLWISTSRGLVRWNPLFTKKDIYTTANGLLSDQFNYNSGFKDASGKLYFGCVKGMICFNPNSFSDSKFTAPLYITSVQAEGKEIANWNNILENQFLEDKNRDKTPHYIDIPHKKSSITIEFAALSYTAPEMIQYQYKLEGLDKNWTYLSSNRKVYFTNLSPGEYKFRVKATNVSGKWNDKETTLYIRILPTFWESNMAMVLYTIIGLAIVGFLFRSYHDRQKEKNKRIVEHMAYIKEKELYEAKLDFFTHVTHEIKTPLTLIKAPLEKITKQIDSYPTINKYVKMIQRNTARLIALSEQLLDFRKTEVAGYKLNIKKIDIRHLLKELQPDFKALAKEKNIKFKMILPDEEVIIEADKDALTKILTNLLDNGTKYAEFKLESGLEKDEVSNNIIFYTKNDGPLIDEENKDRIFEPFVRMETAQSSSGAGLGLSLCRRLAELHQGSLYIDTKLQGFNKFILTLPITQKAIQNQI